MTWQGQRIFTNADILRFRREWDAGQVNVRAWANAFGVTPETMRRIGRRDTYRHLAEAGEQADIRSPSTKTDVMRGEPTESEISASLARFASLAKEESGQTADDLIAELQGRAKSGPEEQG